MKSKTNQMWHRICECERVESLQPRYWKMLRTIALSICKTNFSLLNKDDTLNILIKSLQYSEWKELQEIYSVENKINFLIKCYMRAQERYNGDIKAMFKDGSELKRKDKKIYDEAKKDEKDARNRKRENEKYIGVAFGDGGSILKKFNRARIDLGIAYEQHENPDNDKVWLKDIAEDFPGECEYGEQSLTEIYYMLKNRIEATQKIKKHGLRKIR